MFDDIVGKSDGSKILPKKKMKPVDQSKSPTKGWGGINEEEGYSWGIRVTRDGASIVEIVTIDELNLDEQLMDEIIKKLRRMP